MSSAITPVVESTETGPNAQLERQLGDTEVSYFLPSRESGVNDMYLHLGFNAPQKLFEGKRLTLVWAIMRLRHPLLASEVIMNDYDDVRFRYHVPKSAEEAIQNAQDNLDVRDQGKDALIDSYLNGPRTLSQGRLSYLIVGNADENHAVRDGALNYNYDIIICATHFLGDGMALHQFANDFFTLLASALTDNALLDQLSREWRERSCPPNGLPQALEDRLPPPPGGTFLRAATRVDFENSQTKFIGGHTFPRAHGKERKTIVPTIAYDEEKTKVILKKCKTHGVSVSAALFAICSIAWSRTTKEGWDLPVLMYSALNLRPTLKIDRTLHDSYWFIAIGYFNVMLPSFLPHSDTLEAIFWLRAQSAKVQSAKAAKAKMLVSRSLQMARLRATRARVWAKEDDDKLRGIDAQKPKPPPPPSTPSKPKVPSNALIGLSLLGNLDGIYKHAAFPDIQLHTLTTGSRQRSGGMLLFGYTFVQKLWVSFGYDEAGFEEQTVKRFWDNVILSIDEFLVK